MVKYSKGLALSARRRAGADRVPEAFAMTPEEREQTAQWLQEVAPSGVREYGEWLSGQEGSRTQFPTWIKSFFSEMHKILVSRPK